jgi:hypothetical protein
MSIAETYDLLEAAEEDGEAWQTVEEACEALAEAQVTVHEVLGPLAETETGERVRIFSATVSAPEVGGAAVEFRLGVKGDMVFTGYDQPEFQDQYQITLCDGRTFTGRLYWPDDPDAEPAMARAWHTVSPVKMTIFYAIFARLLQRRPVVDRQPSERPRTPLHELGLSLRPYNFLMRAGIDAVELLTSRDEEQIADVPGVEEEDLEEIKAALAERGWSLSPPLRDLPIEELDLGMRAYNNLKRVGIRTIGQLIEYTSDEILAIPKLGRRQLRSIEEGLSELGLFLKGPST